MGQTGPADPPPGAARGGDSSLSRATPDPGASTERPPIVVAVVTSAPASPGAAAPPAPRAGIPAQRAPGDEVPAALAAQTRPVDRVVRLTVAGPAPAARLARAFAPGEGARPGDFVWLLDETTRPAPDTLERLLACAALDPGAAVLGPTGITVDRGGRRLRAVGPPRAVRDVLAVDRAGALVRVDAWRRLAGPNPLAGRADDVDLCWRAWRAGLRVVAVPSARLLPRAGNPADPDRRDRVERTDALRVRLAQSGALDAPAAALGVVLACLARVVTALAAGRLRDACVDVLVVAGAMADPARLWRLARYAAGARVLPPRTVRPLLPRLTRPGAGPAAITLGERPPPPATGRHGMPRPRSAAMLTALLVAAGCALTRFGGTAARGVPLPGGARDLYAALWSGWLGPAAGQLGGPGPAPAYTPLLAALATLTGGSPALAARLLVAAALPLAGLAAYRAAGALDGLAYRPAARAVLAACYALSAPVTAAALGGDLAAVGASVAAPLVGRGVLGLLAADSGWRPVPALGAALLVGVACAPGLLAVTAAGLVALLVARRHDRLAAKAVAVLAVGCAPLLPALGVAARHGPAAVLSVLVDTPARPGTDTWAFALGAVACLLAAVSAPRGARRPVALCWLVVIATWVTGQDTLAVVAGLAGAALAWTGRAGTPRLPAGRGRPPALVVALAVAALAAPPLLFARAAGALGSPPGTPGDSGGGTVVARPETGRALVLRESAGAVTYTLTGQRAATVVDLAGVTPRPAREFLAGVVADLAVGGGWGVSALPALGVATVSVPTGGGADPTLVAALDAADGLERDQPRAGSYSWRLLGVSGDAGAPRLLTGALAATARAGGGPGGSADAARAVVGDRAATGPGSVLATADGRARVPAGGAGRLLVLAEPADAGWRATMNGHALTAVVAWGWAQAFALPAGPAGEADVGYDHGAHRVLVLAQAADIALFALAAGAAAAARRRSRGERGTP